MKLLRYGDPGKERPGVLHADGTIRDLSGTVQDISGGTGPFHLRREGNADDCDKRAAIQSVTLNNKDWSTKPRPRSDRIAEVRPPNLALANHHSEFSRTLRAAR